MESDTAGFTLPPAPGGLCFDRNDFVKTNFSVDNFLAEHQNVSSLETMRDDLGAYLKVLRLAMIELINKDYANFVNLSATLIGFDKAIAKIQTPLTQLNGEVLGVKQCLDDAMKELSMWLNQRHGLQKKKQLLRYYSQTINSLSTLENILQDISNKKKHEQIALADRAAMQYNQLKFSISKCESLIKSDQKTQFNNIGGKLIQHLNDLLFIFWNDSDENNMLKALLTLASLDRVTETEMLVRKQAIAPLLQDIISEPALQRSKDGLQGVYERILALLDTKLKLLHSVMEHSKMSFLAKQYRFLVNCFWCEVESRLEVNLASIFAPGNPKIFYRRYNESVQFVRKLEEYCGDPEMVRLLHETAEYKNFQKRWNLPVYFQIRFQEIAGSFEATLQSAPIKQEKDGLVLKETYSCWVALQQCWSDGVYIEALAHKFWKLSLQLLARYSTWCCTICTQKSPKLEPTSVNRTLIDNSISIYVDTQTLLQRLPQFLQSIEHKVPCQKDILRNSLKITEATLQGNRHKIKESIVNEMSDYFNIQLKQVSDIPRLYRKTNRSVPTKPCTYIDVVSREVHQFNESGSQRLDNAFMQEIFAALFNVMTESYYKYVEDVLTSVQKTEDSLRRLKQIREKTAQRSSESSGPTDGEKIRLQLSVDVVSYGALARAMQVDVSALHKYKELNSMVTEAVKSIDIK
ncbi:conserved oligomeric Golgi complex subunit 2 [Leguminivora glycinivorella]|uniref:conserved oligomeric Golgi complex subunit 2 n=1 Tax=Leguminivora glycinivorella TaxID=1035111 RepID=UPI00200DDFCD|nr:conserved oligomeric Golgi complex subunit 2 [Leguminivora glycinivorella]